MPKFPLNRREILQHGAAAGLLAATCASAQTPSAPSKPKVIITLNGAIYNYPNGPTIPSYFVDFREDGRIVFHLGALGNLTGISATAEPYHLGPHNVRIEGDGNVLLDLAIANHWWNSEWTFRPRPLSTIRTPAQLVAANRMFPFGDTGCRVNGVQNYKFAGPMDSAGVTTYMPTTGERPDVGWVTDPSGYFMLTNDARRMLAWAQAAGSCPLHFRDEATGRPIDLIRYPKANAYDEPRLQGAPWLPKGPKDEHGYNAFGGGWAPDPSHFCEMSYTAYIATGDAGFLEDLQFSANYCVLANAYKSSPRGAVIYSGQERGVAWSLREAFMAHVATKDVEANGKLPASCHPSAYWQKLLDQSLPYYSQYTKDPSNQVFRLIGVKNLFAPWQHDYLLTALAFGLLTGHTDWTEIYLFALGNAIDRTSGESGYPVGWGGAYYLYTNEMEKKPDGTWNRDVYDSTKPLSWYDSFIWQKNAPDGPRPTQAQLDSLKADPLNGGIAITGHEYLMTTRAVLVMADFLDTKALVSVRKAYPNLDTCLGNINRMFRANGTVNARVAVV